MPVLIDPALRVIAETRLVTGKRVVFAVLSSKSTTFHALPPGIHPFELEDGRVLLNFISGDVEEALESLLLCGEPALEKKLRPWTVEKWFVSDEPSMRMREIMDMMSSSVNRKPIQIKPKTPWHVAPQMKIKKKAAVVVGAGLAGCFTAYALAKRGWQVRVLDSNPEIAMGASGNRHAVLYPNLSAYQSPLTTWMLHAFIYAARTYSTWIGAEKIQGDLNGILQFAVTDKMRASHASLKNWLKDYPELGEFLSPEQASELAGVHLAEGALWVSQAGWLDSRALCKFLLDTSGITWEPNTEVTALAFDEPVVILANGGHANAFSQTKNLPLKLFRGQLTSMASNAESSNLKLPLCGAGHVLPVDAQGNHWLGASYGEDNLHLKAQAADDEANIAKLAGFSTQNIWSHAVTGSWAGLRAKTLDHVPLVGPVPHVAKFQQQFAALAKDGRKFISHAGEYWPGLYVCAGFGSRGLTSIPLAAEYLAASICGEPEPISQCMAQSLSPARFLVKALKRKT